MSEGELIGFGGSLPAKPQVAESVEHVIIQRPLDRVLAFTRRSIHDVINDPLARNEVVGYYKLYRWVQRESEISDLERQWNKA